MAWKHEDLLKRVQLIAARDYRAILLKNPSGLGYVGQKLGTTPEGNIILTSPQRIQFGLQMPGSEFGGSDLVGMQPLQLRKGVAISPVSPERDKIILVTVSRFVVVEIKIGDDPLKPNQIAFLEAVRLNGGACGVVRDDPEQIHAILKVPAWAVA